VARPAAWYWRRLRRMSPGEIALRSRDTVRRNLWRRLQVPPDQPWPHHPAAQTRTFPVRLPSKASRALPEEAVRSLLKAADDLLDGHFDVLGVARHDLREPDWFLDPLSGRRAPQGRYCFAIDHRSEEEVGNVKQVWELSRHHHLTILAAAWWASGDDRYAEAVDRQLRDWWRANPFLSGVHWTSGIELGIRLISWTWIRRLLDGWPGVTALFEANEAAASQIGWHLRYLSAFPSAGSSANNHVIAEAAGQLTASCAFPWFPESQRWRRQASARLEHQLEANTFPSGINRELASDYHCLVAELGLVAAVETEVSGRPLEASTWALLGRMVDTAAAVVDERGGPPRQGDGDDGRVLLLDAPEDNHWRSLLALGTTLFGELPWWPDESTRPQDVRSTLVGSLVPRRKVRDRPARRPAHFADAGMTLLRTPSADGPEIWCRCDGGPHGFLAIAAHAHADALSVEVRHAGVDVLADPGTYCYHGEPAWRSYFRSTLGHNTLEVDHQDQSTAGGPFLWVQQASTTVGEVLSAPDGEILSWTAEHDGYRRLDPPVTHRRTVTLDPAARRVTIVDRLGTSGRHRCRLAFHLGPEVEAVLEGSTATLTWPSGRGDQVPARGILRLPEPLDWSVHRGEEGPILGWHSPGFGRKERSTTLIGDGSGGGADLALETVLRFEVGS
jgi:hypothetical protein